MRGGWRSTSPLGDRRRRGARCPAAAVARRASGANLPRLGAGFCETRQAADLAAFLRPLMDRFAGGPRALEQVVEEIGVCAAFRRAQRASAQAYLEGLPR